MGKDLDEPRLKGSYSKGIDLSNHDDSDNHSAVWDVIDNTVVTIAENRQMAVVGQLIIRDNAAIKIEENAQLVII